MAGRRPKPTHLKLVAGNPGKRKLNKREPKPPREIPSPPAHLSDRAKVAWGEFSARLDAMGVLTGADAAALERAAEAYADLVMAAELLRDEGWVLESETTSGAPKKVPHPMVAIYQDADRRLRAWLVEFGLTPSSRTKVQRHDPAPEISTAASRYLK